jgi:signal transduction histidine kinase
VSREARSLTKREGLNSDFVYFAAVDNDYIWVGTERGIARLRMDDRLNVSEHLYFDQDNGLTGIETNQNAYFISKDTKYFGLVDGLYEYNDLHKNVTSGFDLHLTGVELLYGEYDPLRFSKGFAGFFKIPQGLELPPDRNHLTFNYNRVDKRYPNSVKFRYYLENFDKGWSLPSSLTSVTYSNLPPGEYVFRVMATNGQGSWSEKAITYAFTIRQPFYQTASFIFGTVLFLAGSVTLLLYIRVRQRVRKAIETERIRITEIENLRKEIARDFHDEMGNQLTRIINYISLLKLRYASQSYPNGSGYGNGVNGTNGSDLYTKVEESAKYLYTGTRDFIWAIDPGNDELSKLFIHIRDFGEKLFEEKRISFRAFNHVKDVQPLPNGFSREANLIFKEVMTNAFKYSHAKNVTLALDKDPTGSYLMMFEDDGAGFCTDQITKSNGLKNISVRAEKINAVLRIQSEQGRGTQVSLRFKIQKTAKHGVTV